MYFVNIVCDVMASFPALRIDWVNTHWQRLYTEAGDQLLFYSAFYDNRTRTGDSYPESTVIDYGLEIKLLFIF